MHWSWGKPLRDLNTRLTPRGGPFGKGFYCPLHDPFRILLLIAAVVLLASLAFAQTVTTGDVAGTIADQTGAVIQARP